MWSCYFFPQLRSPSLKENVGLFLGMTLGTYVLGIGFVSSWNLSKNDPKFSWKPNHLTSSICKEKKWMKTIPLFAMSLFTHSSRSVDFHWILNYISGHKKSISLSISDDWECLLIEKRENQSAGCELKLAETEWTAKETKEKNVEQHTRLKRWW